MNQAIQTKKSEPVEQKNSALTSTATSLGLASALGGVAAVLAPEIPVVALGAAVIGAVGGLLLQKLDH
jgi:hypothetical protein